MVCCPFLTHLVVYLLLMACQKNAECPHVTKGLIPSFVSRLPPCFVTSDTFRSQLISLFLCRINLPKKLKMQKPRYQDYQADSIQDVEEENLKVRVIAGTYKGVTGPVVIQNPSMLMDVQIKPGGVFTQQVGSASRSHTPSFTSSAESM